jgi:hypothetical protein
MKLVEANESAAQYEEGVMDVVAALIADGEAPEAMEPRDGRFDHPAIPAEFLAAVDAASGEAGDDAQIAGQAMAA